MTEQKYKSILEQAQAIVHGRRQEDHGHPLDVFELTARLWSAALGAKIKTEQVPILHILYKIAREQIRPKHDNRLDIAGYAETLEMCIQEAASRNSVSQGTTNE